PRHDGRAIPGARGRPPPSGRAGPALGAPPALLRSGGTKDGACGRLRARTEPRAMPDAGHLSGGRGLPPGVSPCHGTRRTSSKSSASAPLVAGAADIHPEIRPPYRGDLGEG